MRIRTLAAAALVAAGLSVTLTGAASAAPAHEPPPPPGEPVIVTCEDGNAVVRPATEEDLKKIEEEKGVKFDGGPIVEKRKGEGHGRYIRIIQIIGHAPPGAAPGKIGPPRERVEIAPPGTGHGGIVPPGADSWERAKAVCAAGEPAVP